MQSVVGRTFDRLARGDRALRGPPREVHGRRGPRRLRRPAGARGRRRTGGPRRPRDAGHPLRAEPRLRRRGQADARHADRRGGRRGPRRRRTRVRTARPDADRRRRQHRRAPADRRPNRARSSSGPPSTRAPRTSSSTAALEPLDLKGKAEPVPAWRALRIKARIRGERPQPGHGGAPRRPRRGARRPQADLPSRPDRRPARARDGDRPGRRRASPASSPSSSATSKACRRSPTGVEVDASPTATPPTPRFADAIKAQCEIFDDDSAEVAAGKAEAAVRELFGDDSVAPQLRALVGAGETRDMSREELFEAWRRFLERLAARYPLVLVLDDIHWADDGLLDFIEHVADWAQGPIMVVATARAGAVREAADLGRRQAQRDLDLPRPALRRRGRGDARRPAAGADRAGAEAHDRRAQRGQPALRRGDRPQADRRRRAPRDRGLPLGGGAHRRRRSSSRARSRG